MRYDCGHDGCDICGGRRCDENPIPMETYQLYGSRGGYTALVCKFCVRRAIKFTLETAQAFGGMILDPSKPCHKPRSSKPPTLDSETRIEGRQ